MQKIDWKDLSDLGLLRRINEDILHPLGLAISRELDGTSKNIIVADDGVFTYASYDTKRLSDQEIKSKLQEILKCKKVQNEN